MSHRDFASTQLDFVHDSEPANLGTLGHGPLAEHARAPYPGGDMQGRLAPWRSSFAAAESSTEIGAEPSRTIRPAAADDEDDRDDGLGVFHGLLVALSITLGAVGIASLIAWAVS